MGRWRPVSRAGRSGASPAGDRTLVGTLHDATTGDVLFQTRLPASAQGYPITYAVDGRQYVAISTGYGRFLDLTPELSPSANNNLFIFALPE